MDVENKNIALTKKNSLQSALRFLLFLLVWFASTICARQVDTFYGAIEVQEPVLLDLIDSPTFQRLKDIHQYGVSYYTTHREEYSRYAHSIGVFAILRANGASLEGQIAGLLHDVSHTAFSHVGDWIFGKENQDKGYQDNIHALFLEESGLGDILRKHNFTIDQVFPSEERFPALENSLPNLCADRIDYNIQGAYYQGFITYEEAQTIFKEIRFIGNRWVSTCPELMKKIARFSLFMTQDCWGSPANYLASRWLADAILRSIELGSISLRELHFGTDQVIWDRLTSQSDPLIKRKMEMVIQAKDYFSILSSTEGADLVIKSKFRGINPWVVLDSTPLRLTEVDPDFAEEYENVRQIVKRGWPVKIFL